MLGFLTFFFPCVDIFVDTYIGKTVFLEVKPSYTIGNIKVMINAKLHIPINEQALIFDEMLLGDSGTLASFSITKESTLTLLHKSKGLMQIFIRYEKRIICTLQVKPCDTIRNMLTMIPGFSPNDSALIFNEVVLEDSSTLSDFHINNNSTLTLIKK